MVIFSNLYLHTISRLYFQCHTPKYITILSRGSTLCVYRRQTRTFLDGPRTEKVPRQRL